MNMKKSALAFIVCLFLVLAFGIVYIFSELYSEDEAPIPEITDAMRFKEEYEKVNGEKQGEATIRSLSISEENPFIYATEDDIVKMIEDKKTFVVYFGFSTCPWCRSVMESMIESAKKNNIDKIYYVDVLNIRDKYELNDKNEAVKTVEGSKGYYKLLELLDSVLDDYSPLTYKNKKGKTKKVVIDEKRIYAPNVVVIKNGNAVSLETGMVETLVDPYMELNNDIKNSIKCTFDCLFELMTENNTCSADTIC